ncbi:MAG: flagellar basal-body rod protein FlgF [Deltaproteobacteria bacterium]|nr:flagellar basal-body rod protein FlgF [Deltaproteobacteria bacterium]MBI3293987.1 flagellar basal-body rod protein FlgF [Deltaproteobacteria bacterium]
MDKGIFTALSGGIAKGHELELVANNLANANTPGFRRDVGTFNEYMTELRRQDSVEGLQREITAETLLDGRPAGDKSFVEMDGTYTSFKQGTVYRTGRSLDVAIEGKGFLEVLTPSGIRYTRQGNLSLGADGTLVTANGYPVLSGRRQKAGEGAFGDQEAQGRVITLKEGDVRIAEDGSIYQNNAPIGSLSVVEFKEDQWLEKVGNAYFRNVHPDNANDTTENTRVHQSFLEGSNVNAVSEMTKLIEITRAYESHMQAIKTYQDMDKKSANDIAKG